MGLERRKCYFEWSRYSYISLVTPALFYSLLVSLDFEITISVVQVQLFRMILIWSPPIPFSHWGR